MRIYPRIANMMLACVLAIGLAPALVHPQQETKKPKSVKAASQTNSPAASKHYKLGQIIQLKKGLTLKILRGSAKSLQLFTSNRMVTDTSFVIDLEFGVSPQSEGEVLYFKLGESQGSSDVFLKAGEEILMPIWWGSFLGPRKPQSGRVEDRLIVMPIMESGKNIMSFQFDLNSDRMKQKKKLEINFEVLEKVYFSFVIDLDSQGN